MQTIRSQMRILGVTWFNETGSEHPIGIVLAEFSDTKLRKAFIGTGLGLDADRDAQHILENGAKFFQAQVQNLNNELLDKT